MPALSKWHTQARCGSTFLNQKIKLLSIVYVSYAFFLNFGPPFRITNIFKRFTSFTLDTPPENTMKSNNKDQIWIKHVLIIF